MEMTPEQLRELREERRMTREELAVELDCSAGAIVHWEGGKRSIPSWVADKMYSQMPITFTVQELGEMYDICREECCTMSELIQDSIRFRIDQRAAARRAGKTQTARNITYLSNDDTSTRVAEDPPPKPPRRSGTKD
jgi:transcriptional regulator with XRE-family HTH domain